MVNPEQKINRITLNNVGEHRCKLTATVFSHLGGHGVNQNHQLIEKCL